MLSSKRFMLMAALAAVVALAPALAEARGGRGGSFGSRGVRTEQAAPPTQTAPVARPVERSATPTSPTQAQRPAMNPAQGQSWFQRNPFMSGMIGGLIGAGLIGMLLGGGFFGAGFDMSMLLGLLLQLALIGGVVWLVVSLLRRRAPAQPGYAMAGGPQNGPLAREGLDMPRHGGGGGAGRGGRDEIGVKPSDLNEFERLLGVIQGAWSNRDLGTLRRHLTPEMADYFAEALDEDARRGVVNKIEQVKLEQGDVAEAWSERGAAGDTRYATVAMRWSAVDYDLRQSDGAVVAGSNTQRSDATEVWTFRSDGRGPWVLSAIQQV